MTAPRAEILALHAEGLSNRAVARSLGIWPMAVHRVLRDAGLTRPRRNGPVPKDVKAAALARCAAGETADSVAASLGIGRVTVQRWARAAGVGRSRGGRYTWRPEWTADALERKRRGDTWQSIADAYGVTPMTPLRNVVRALRAGSLRV